MVHTRLSTIKKKYILPTSGGVDITNTSANNDSNNVTSTEKITKVVVPETQNCRCQPEC